MSTFSVYLTDSRDALMTITAPSPKAAARKYVRAYCGSLGMLDRFATVTRGRTYAATGTNGRTIAVTVICQ